MPSNLAKEFDNKFAQYLADKEIAAKRRIEESCNGQSTSEEFNSDFTIHERLISVREGEVMPIKPFKLEDLGPAERKFVENIATEEVAYRAACKQRIRKSGDHCWYCGSTSKTVKCDRLYPESFRCTEKKSCAECSRAHKVIANHINLILKYPVVRRADSRRFTAWYLLSNAIEGIEEPEVNAGRIDLADTLGCNISPDEDLAWEMPSEKLRSWILGGFRRTKFVDFQKLAAALQQEIQDEALHSAARLLRLVP
jgi:hypothetical protein